MNDKFKSGTNSAQNTANQGASRAQSATHASGGSEFKNFVSDIEDLLKSSAALTGEELEKAKQKIGERITQAKDSLEDVKDTVVDRCKKTAAATDDYVHDQPWTAIGAGAAVGLFIGFLLARR